MTKDILIGFRETEPIHGTLYGTDLDNRDPLVIYVHGFKGFKDWGFVPHLGKSMVEKGIRMLAFNFSHNGIGKKPMDFTELERFKRNTFSREVLELNFIINWVVKEIFHEVDEPRIGLLGHSRGGGVALLAASGNPYVDAVVTWSSVATFDRYSEDEKASWKSKGYKEVTNARTKQVFQMDVGLLEDLEQNQDQLDILKAAKQMTQPLLIIHGSDDEAVDVSDADLIHDAAGPADKSIQKIAGGSHTFGARHPFAGSTQQLDEAISASADFFAKHL